MGQFPASSNVYADWGEVDDAEDSHMNDVHNQQPEVPAFQQSNSEAEVQKAIAESL